MKEITYELWCKYKGDKEWTPMYKSNDFRIIAREVTMLLSENLRSKFPKTMYKICESGDYWWQNYD